MLNQYISDVRDLLHDPNGQLWSNAQITNYVNKARNRVAADTKCLRTIISLQLIAGQESYPVNAPIIDVMGVDLYYGTVRSALDYYPWTQFSAMFRSWQTFQTLPVAFSRLGTLLLYFGPAPDQAYNTDWICAISPTALTSDTTPETITPPFTDVVRFWACYEAKFYQQAFGEAEIFKKEYWNWIFMNQRAINTRTIPRPYEAGA